MSSSVPAVTKSSTSTQAQLVPSISSVTVTSPSISQPPNSSIDTVSTASDNLSISTASSSSTACSVLETTTTTSNTIPTISQDTTQTSKPRKKKRPPKNQSNTIKPKIEIKTALHRPRKPAPTEYSTDEEDMIVYDVEDEPELNPKYVISYKGELVKGRNCASIRALITNFFIPELNNHDVQELWFQLDGATCHTDRATIDLLKDTFGDRLISRFGPVNWPPRSCDLTPLDYFLWGYVKSLVYADKPQTLDHLEDNIRRVIADIRPQMLEKVIENWTSRLDYIRASRGSPIPENIFKM
ncbi:uncharacterized protein TNCV_129381 [Trichonephila clavipes]|nr:uncharacterized protein TNCV_129381 [Trichonephila clavipes]